LEPYGIELVQELFLDQSKAPIDTREQIRWGAYKKQDKRAPDAQPFNIRAIPPNFDKASAITSRLSDILLIWANRWRPLKGKFPESLSWRTLIASSEDCWSIDWQGGFLSEENLQKGNYFDKKQPLCVMVEGVFPTVPAGSAASGEAKPGKLLLIGSSKLFDNGQLDTTKYDHEKFILNAVADLAYGSDLAGIQASGGSLTKGFAFVPSGKKLLWRLAVMCLVPFLFLVYSLYHLRAPAVRRKKTRAAPHNG
jgi:hypothetical protein